VPIIFISFQIGAFDRFVYIHGHTSLTTSPWSKWCRRISTKSASIILLILPILCSLPIAICNLLHAHVLHTSLRMKICIVQYTHKILISFLIFFYILPLLFSFFLHAKLIYFIRSKHQHYLTAAPYILPMKRTNTLDSQIMVPKQRRIPNQNILSQNQQLLQPKKITTTNRRIVMYNTDTIRNTAGTGTLMTTTTGGGQQVGANNLSNNSSGSSRSSNGASYSSITSPVILYKINSQANANAKRTVLLLVLLLSFYVLCWAPYNIYTWSHAYRLSTNNQNDSLINRTLLSSDFNHTIIAFTDNLQADLRRIIFINYSLYLLSMISMCFSFIFYFSLNKQARREFTTIIGCMCPSFINIQNRKQKTNNNQKPKYERARGLQYHTRYQHHYPCNNLMNNNQRVKTTKFKTHITFVPSAPLLAHRQQNKKHINCLQPKINNTLPKRTILNYGCHVECCP
jgi:hypothetical protein